ncbi:Iron-regulated protein A precursor [Fulvivirga imtechensis AK7]|uniref:Iron-regulated protein A n=1 Tax=Fulvivirga imtechensis AK7 TaxID=1237149 RepID=L8JVG0_9BACT|nr:imelysin family protein [Fulvivirga imtechensis]ELR71599.1 Iron-regulated protein A precursor [Fulvivirga imtechensis AK7]
MKNLFSTITLLAILTAIGCKNDDSGSVTPGFDRQLMLEELADNVIIPAYDTLNKTTTTLDAAMNAFVADPTTTTLSNARTAFEAAYHAWQRASFWDFGPAFDAFLISSLNSFPASKVGIDNNIATGTYDFSTSDAQSQKGFPAIDYLLYGVANTEAGVVDMFTNDANADNRRAYIQAVMEDIVKRVHDVASAWSGTYRQSFINKDGTDVGSSVGLIVNELNKYFERVARDKKIGIPLGKRSNGIPIPANVEAYYSGISISLALENLKAIRDFYMGIGPEEDVTGLYEYLDAINAQEGTLADVIKDQFELAIKEVGEIPSPYSETVETNPGPANEAYQELQALVVLLKADMPSALGVLITYQDNDGD